MARRFEFEDYKGPLLAVLLLVVQTFAHGCLHRVLAEGASGTTFGLLSSSDQEVGCFAPCACPVMIHSPMKGSLRLVPVVLTGSEERYDVRDVDWTVGTPNGSLRITGSGSYVRMPATNPQQRMILDLSLDGSAPMRFDSGADPLTVPWPAIEVAISRHGEFCWDTLFTVSAAPATAGIDPQSSRPRLEAARPSPFRDRVDLAFTLASADRIELAVFEASGRRVRTLIPDSWRDAGPHAVSWDGTDDRGRPVAAGVLFARLRTSIGTARTTLVRIR